MRRAAVSRLGNVAVLTEVVRRESDAQVRDEAAGVLLDIALGAYEADEAASLAAVEGLTALAGRRRAEAAGARREDGAPSKP